MPFSIQHNDITRLTVDAIVNAANSGLRPGGGVCGAIFAAAGHEALEEACRAIGHCPVGGAVITPGFGLNARYVVHAVGPIWQGGGHNEAALLESAYRNAMQRAWDADCRSIAFPLISSGIYGYPKEAAFRIAVDTIRDFLTDHDMDVILTVFDRSSTLLGERYHQVSAFIDDHYVMAKRSSRRAETASMREQLAEQADMDCMPCPSMAAPCMERSLDELVEQLEESFNAMLLRLIDQKGFSDTQVYKRANLDRKHFSKLRKEGYNPSKTTAVALAIALRLNLDETKDFLGRAGYALTRASKFDVIIEYCIREGIYDIFEVNELLFAFDERLLG